MSGITFTFHATATDPVLSFMSLTPYANSYGALIDNVRVNEVVASVPDPGSSLPLLGIALSGLRACRTLWN